MTEVLSQTLMMIVRAVPFQADIRLRSMSPLVYSSPCFIFCSAALLRHMRPILIAMACVNACAAAIWIGCIFVELPRRYAMLWIAIAIGSHF